MNRLWYDDVVKDCGRNHNGDDIMMLAMAM